jgi:hypothetical protein
MRWGSAGRFAVVAALTAASGICVAVDYPSRARAAGRIHGFDF